MAPGKTAVLFDDIIQADRQRKKNEELAKQIFGKGAKTTTQRTGNHKSGLASSLASRVGVTKRSLSSSPILRPSAKATWRHDLHHVNNQLASRTSRRENSTARRSNLLHEAATSISPRNGKVRQADAGSDTGEINIRGTASGPYLVVGSNFAPGTTAADIESAMLPSGGEMESCRITTFLPTVTAEMVFAEKANAENVIDTFNNKKADGRILSLHIMSSGPSVLRAIQNIPTEPKAARIDLTVAEPARHDSLRADLIRPDATYDSQREQSDRSRRRADPEFQDGSYGFETKQDRMDIDAGSPRRDGRLNPQQRETEGVSKVDGQGQENGRLYSDDLYQRRGRGHR